MNIINVSIATNKQLEYRGKHLLNNLKPFILSCWGLDFAGFFQKSCEKCSLFALQMIFSLLFSYDTTVRSALQQRQRYASLHGRPSVRLRCYRSHENVYVISRFRKISIMFFSQKLSFHCLVVVLIILWWSIVYSLGYSSSLRNTC
jgi:hypothetical protein